MISSPLGSTTESGDDQTTTMNAPDDDHRCGWRDRAEALTAEVEDLKARLDAMERRIFGKKGERMPSKGDALRKGEPSKRNGDAAQQKRRDNSKAREALEARTIEHPVPPTACACPACGGVADRQVGEGRSTTVYEYIPPRFERQRHVQQTLACRCGQYVVTAPPLAKVVDKGQYGPGLVAQIVVARTLDATPLHRQANQFLRLGIPINKSQLCSLYHRAAELAQPIYACILELVAAERVVQGDETPLKMHGTGGGKSRTGYMWTFLNHQHIAYVHSSGRSGEVPVAVLGGTKGVLVVDAYSGYNAVCTPASRTRAGCLAHVRRKFFEARGTAQTAADEAMALILEVYRIEEHARIAGILRAPAHRELRRTQSRPAMERFHAWLLEQKDRWPPKGPLGKAIAYALNQWDALCVFLDDEHVPPDNNRSENALRIIALGRKNWQLVGHEEAGQNTAILHTIVANCVLAGVNPQEYLADVLIRVQSHPANRIAELTPERWKATRAAESALAEAAPAVSPAGEEDEG